MNGNSGHPLELYLQTIRTEGFNLIDTQDITDSVSPTLEFGLEFLSTVMSEKGGTARLAEELLDPNRSNTERLIFTGGQQSAELLDVKEFLKNKRYMIFLFKADD
jgi:hypothetical protein